MSGEGDFAGKVAVITGGASGIGLAIGKRLIALGGFAVLADREQSTLEAAAGPLGDRALTHVCDVSDLSQVEALANVAFGWKGRVDLVLNNAGVGGPSGRLWDIDPDEARAHFDVNFWGAFYGSQVFARRLAQQEIPSALYNTASENSFFCAAPRMGTYVAAKHAVLGMTESLREDVPPQLHVGTIIPGWVYTGIGQDKFMRHGMVADDYAAIVVPQLLGNARFVVSHKSNRRHIAERMDALAAAYDALGENAGGVDEYDVRAMIEANRPKG
ncbi:SDR family NAD(P)-dependent oxidoreductase [Qipengyuania sp. DSG2-2]|uniref:SDR family NAD(P)-dependent oxidoreductase n=1 Tax=Qipengyuania sp. DGS2-2 TaxID=3349631 RepID=UPI0036D32F0F